MVRMVESLHDPAAIYCIAVITCGGAMALAMVWKFWFSKTAPQNPSLLGGLAGFSSGCLAAAAYALHCDRDIALYICIFYGLPIAMLSLAGSVLGRKFLKW